MRSRAVRSSWGGLVKMEPWAVVAVGAREGSKPSSSYRKGRDDQIAGLRLLGRRGYWALHRCSGGMYTFKELNVGVV